MSIAIHRLDCEANSKWASLTAVAPDGAVVGVADVVFGKEEKERSAYIQGLFVAASHRRQGIGRALLRDAVAACRNAGKSSAWLQVSHENTSARALYESEGFFVLSYDAGSDQHTYAIDLSRPR